MEEKSRKRLIKGIFACFKESGLKIFIRIIFVVVVAAPFEPFEMNISCQSQKAKLVCTLVLILKVFH